MASNTINNTNVAVAAENANVMSNETEKEADHNVANSAGDSTQSAEIADKSNNLVAQDHSVAEKVAAQSALSSVTLPDSCKQFFLLQDTCARGAPKHLIELWRHVDITCLSPAEMLFLLVYLNAVELGFAASNQVEQLNLTPLKSYSSYHHGNVNRLALKPPVINRNIDGSFLTLELRNLVFSPKNKQIIREIQLRSGHEVFSNDHDVLLSGICTGDQLICTVTPTFVKNAPGYSVSLSIQRYIFNPYARQMPPQRRLLNMNKLSLQLRNALFVPIRNQELEHFDIDIFPSLDGLPFELYDRIYQYLTGKQLKQLVQVNKRLCDTVMESKYYWKLHLDGTKDLSKDSCVHQLSHCDNCIGNIRKELNCYRHSHW